MEYVFLLLSALATVHAACFGLWLNKNGNKPGALCVFALSLLCLILPVYRMVIAK